MTTPDPEAPRVRLLFVIPDLARAGAETQLVRLVERLDRKVYLPSVVMLKKANDFASELEAAHVPVSSLGRRGWWDLGIVRRLRAHVDRVQPDIVHSWLFLANLVSALACPSSPSRPLVMSQRCSYEATLPPWWRRVARWSHRRADRILVNSRAALEEEVAAGTPRHLLAHVPNGVVAEETAAVPRDELGLPPGPLAVCVGQLEHIKGHDVLLAAWPAVRARVPGAHLVLVGEGPRRQALAAQARATGVAGAVTFAGFRSPAAPYVAAADVFVQPSRTEGMPNALLEAMARGRPVVATAVGGVPEVLADGREGRLVPSDSPPALADAVAGLLADPAAAARLGAAARAATMTRFSLASTVGETERLYATLLASRREAAASAAVPNKTGPTVTP